jgi:hypothetical protein
MTLPEHFSALRTEKLLAAMALAAALFAAMSF